MIALPFIPIVLLGFLRRKPAAKATTHTANGQPASATAEPTIYERMVGIEQNLAGLYADREQYGKRLAAQDKRITEQDQMIRDLQVRNEERQQMADKLADSLDKRIKEIGALEKGLEQAESSKREQGQRIGRLESAIPVYRSIAGKAILIIEAWEQYAESLRALLREAGIPHAEPIGIPKLPDLPEDQGGW